MFFSAQISDCTQATINLANVTHITQYESEYPEAGSVIHFTSGTILQVSAPISELSRRIDAKSRSGEQPFILPEA